jgi:Domain of unknown function (DUF4258)
MEIVYSQHARKRMNERKISKVAVYTTLVNPDKKLLAERDRAIARKKFKNRTLEVIYVVENNKIIIITLYYL